MLFDTGRQAGASFALFDEANSELYHTVKQNLTGGPSIIFNRHHEVGQSYIRNDPDETLSEDSRIRCQRSLSVVHRPGHADWGLCSSTFGGWIQTQEKRQIYDDV